MTFQWPQMLWLMTVLPVLVLLYVWLLRRRKKATLRYASLNLVKDAMGTGQRIRRHIPPLLFLFSLAAMIASIARPMAVITLPSQHDLVVLAMDVSRSMEAEDVKPTRLVAAQAAARTFIAEQPRDTRIAVVSFAATAALVQSATNVREDVVAAIDRFQLQRGTAIGSGILVSLATIFPDAKIDLSSTGSDASPPSAQRRGALSLDQSASAANDNAPDKPVAPGSYGSAAIILLTDGQTTTGMDPIEAAKMAADRGVRIFTVGIGTIDGEVLHTEGWSMHVRLDEETLKKIADITRGEYYYAGTALDLKKVYQTLNSKLVFETKETEITAFFSAVAAVLALISGLLSVLWFNRIL
jgi:Ca-activated chloride channel homolog